MRILLVGVVASLCGCSSVRGFLYPPDPMSVSDDRDFHHDEDQADDARAFAHTLKTVGVACPFILPAALAAQMVYRISESVAEANKVADAWLIGSANSPAPWPKSTSNTRPRSVR